MYESTIIIRRCVDALSEAPAGSDASLDNVCRKVSTYVTAGLTALAAGTATKPASLASADLKNLLIGDYPAAEVETSSGVWIWKIDPETGHRYLVCTEAEVVLKQEKKSNGSVVALDPPIGVSVEMKMASY